MEIITTIKEMKHLQFCGGGSQGNTSIVNERRTKMIGMDFISFIILLVISIVVSGVLHFFIKFYVRPGWWSYASKVLIGWVGVWLGSPVFGYWWQGLNYKEVYIIPAILGSLASVVFVVDLSKSCSTIFRSAG
jgi:uncharacterized membrane protein YeaQ/YmgE (transglycosylase-associated protein family)